MIPIRDTIPSRTFPFVTIALIVVNVLVFLYEMSLGDDLDGFIRVYALVPAHFTAGADYPLHWTPVFVSMFLHGGVAHVAGNMLYLWIFGDNVEDRLGHVRFLIFYLLSGVAAALAHIVVDPTSHLPMVGASGAIAGVLGAYFITYPRSQVLAYFPPIFFFHVPALLFLGFWFVAQVWSGGMTLHATPEQHGGIAFMAHVGGFVAGIVLMLILRPPEKKQLPPGYPERRELPY
jgi:membrane associated rhomboid family serine protease